MAKETVYIVQSYVAGRGKALKAEPQVGCKTAEEARRKAERLGPLRPAVVAFSATADIEMTRVKGVHGPRTLDVVLVDG